MNNEASVGGGRFHTVQPLRDLESNWAVDLSKNLQDYLLKICSGEIAGDDDNIHFSVNFAEAALLLQGSIQVYSRKVEYLYSLVLHALEFVSQKRQHDQPEGVSDQTEEACSHTVLDEEDNFWCLDDIPVEAKNSLDSSTCKDTQPNHIVKPPANLVVLEGDCLDATGDGSELESYLLATNDLYRDFILLDPCDATAVNDYLKCDKAGKWQSVIGVGSSLISKSRKRLQSPINQSGGTSLKSPAGKKHDVNPNLSPPVDRGFDFKDHNIDDNPPGWCIPEGNIDGFEMDGGDSEPGALNDSDDEDDPWKPLNPHEPGNLRVKPFKKVKSFVRLGINSTKQISITMHFPLARIHGTISPELSKAWEARRHSSKREQESKLPFLYEKLRHLLVHGGRETSDAFFDPMDDNEDYENDNGGLDFDDTPDLDMPESRHEYENGPLHPEKQNDGGVYFDDNEDPNSQASLEDLCRSHLDALLASISETEKQTKLAARVSTWKHRIETDLEEQDSRPPFDIHEYGNRVLEKLSMDTAGSGNSMSFTDVVRGQEKHEVARTFSALLQLVNNGSVDIERNGTGNDLICFTGENPFHVRRRLLSYMKKHDEVQLRSSKKRAKSPTRKVEHIKGERDKTYLSTKFPLKLGKVSSSSSSIRCTPEGKRRRRSRLLEPADLQQILLNDPGND